MNRANCWEVLGCGREIGGSKIAEVDMCAAAIAESAHGINGGINGGRICWSIAGTMCSAPSARAGALCETCKFFRQVVREEGVRNVTLLLPGRLR